MSAVYLSCFIVIKKLQVLGRSCVFYEKNTTISKPPVDQSYQNDNKYTWLIYLHDWVGHNPTAPADLGTRQSIYANSDYTSYISTLACFCQKCVRIEFVRVLIGVLKMLETIYISIVLWQKVRNRFLFIDFILCLSLSCLVFKILIKIYHIIHWLG